MVVLLLVGLGCGFVCVSIVCGCDVLGVCWVLGGVGLFWLVFDLIARLWFSGLKLCWLFGFFCFEFCGWLFWCCLAVDVCYGL